MFLHLITSSALTHLTVICSLLQSTRCTHIHFRVEVDINLSTREDKVNDNSAVLTSTPFHYTVS